MAGCCVHGNKLLESIIMRRVSSLAEDLSASQEARFCLQLLTECLGRQVNSISLLYNFVVPPEGK